MTLAEQIAALHNTTPRLEVFVPEWERHLYFKPWTTFDLDEVVKLQLPPGAQHIAVLIRKAENEDGSPAFSEKERPTLYRTMNPVIAMRISERVQSWIPTGLDPDG